LMQKKGNPAGRRPELSRDGRLAKVERVKWLLTNQEDVRPVI
jgi:hypothetical protein